MLPSLLAAQIQGKVVDEFGAPVIGATISIENTYTGTSSNEEGNYEIKLPKSGKEFTIGLDNVGWGKFRLFRIDYVRAMQGAQRQNGWVLGMKFLNF
ncbi:carboxypeptidase-like regulatory domain-containing protein [Sphingobacterium sp. lm-10]|uniref:carboxypeptidase-like regulatory domain-containing protein n=1 Tax=Sphingobacterium sp. lm-10 TaxID=2944904 RepID=UPI0020214E68|nr:carboxypeptidase-like regulatory domain-containing protein [Sphingobacterium sp. lm-10]MCL7987192.1 carboxypeptidase-like regulatory domain-containing protein [Sphingobacterium sp. lm-10]